MKLYELIAALVQYGIDTGLTPACEKIYTTNLLLDQFHEDDYEEPDAIPSLSLEEILEGLLDEACRRELIPDSITYRDLFDTRLMNCLMRDGSIGGNFCMTLYRQHVIIMTTVLIRWTEDILTANFCSLHSMRQSRTGWRTYGLWLTLVHR